MLLLVAPVWGQANNAADVLPRVRQMVEEVRRTAYPELRTATIHLELFDSPSDYFQSRFTFTSFLLRPHLQYVLHVNRHLFVAPPSDEALRAIIAHELGHVQQFNAKARWRSLAYVRMMSPAFTAQMERRTDLLAIARGYGAGLRAYREWLYQHIPANRRAEKLRNYFAPEEIDALMRQLQQHPERMQQWLRHPPGSLRDIER
ncbi:MAG: hypothetical protein U0Y68_04610 [Blastocatellia bacterium]